MLLNFNIGMNKCMEISIIYSTNGVPLKAYLDERQAKIERRRIQDIDDYIDYAVVTMSVEPYDTDVQECEHDWEPTPAVKCEHCGMLIED